MNRTERWIPTYVIVGVLATLAVSAFAVGCGGGTSSADKTATAAAKTAAATKPPTTATAGATATKPPTTATAGATATKAPAATNTPSGAAPTVLIGQATSIGSVLTNPNGFTLYIFKNDVPNSGKSSVPAAIAPNWPPLLATGSLVAPSGLPGVLGSFALPDGSKQVMYNGMPLYTFVGDTQPGQANGQGLLGLWFAATP